MALLLLAIKDNYQYKKIMRSFTFFSIISLLLVKDHDYW